MLGTLNSFRMFWIIQRLPDERGRQVRASSPSVARTLRPNVRGGSKAALTAPKTDFRYTPESGLKTDIVPCPKSATTRLMHRGKRRPTRLLGRHRQEVRV